jgi:mono/diheme cytochrome c family protein
MRPSEFSVGSHRFAATGLGVLILAAGCAGYQQQPSAGTVGVNSAQRSVAAPTFYADVLPILQQNCQACHRSDGRNVGGMTAPMALETYEGTRPWAAAIASAVAEDRMPPWDADVRHKGTFLDERYLDDAEKAILIAWAGADAPAGDPADAPRSLAVVESVPDGGWWLGKPDLVVGFAKPVHVADSIYDWQPTIHVPVPANQHPEARWIRSSELRAGGSYVHHIVSSHLGVGTPGRGAFTYPEGFGVLLPTEPTVTFNMHYYKQPGPGTGIDDETLGAFKFYEPGAVIDYIVQTDLNWNREFVIPAGHPNFEVKRAMPFEEDTYLLSMGPHMHYRGKAVRIELERPDGKRELLLDVPDYDFNWQFLYQFKEPVLMPAGSVLHTTWWFDNSVDNPNNPDPGVDVRYGIETFNEMANARIYFAPAKPRGIIVGEPIPEDVMERARLEEDRRRDQLARSGAIEDHD